MRLTGIASIALILVGCQSERAEAPVAPNDNSETTAAPITAVSKADESAAPLAAEPTPDIERRTAACSAKEKALFSCTVPNGKQIAVCASGEGKVEYRYGKGDAELVLGDPQWASVPYSGGGEAQIAFDNGDTRYIVFSRIVRTNFEPGEPNYPAISDGVIVQRGSDVLSVQACGGEGDLKPVDVNAAERLLPPRSNELFSDETYRADPKVRK